MTVLIPRALTRDAFAPFGDVIELDGARQFAINGGTTQRFHDLARIDASAGGGRPLVSLFRAGARPVPVALSLMERHPLGSQAFLPLLARPYLVVVAADAGGRPGALQAFITRGWQGVNYARNVWHHPLLALEADSDFIVIDRGGEGANLEEWRLDKPGDGRTALRFRIRGTIDEPRQRRHLARARPPGCGEPPRGLRRPGRRH